jgi:hypothetical protein
MTMKEPIGIGAAVHEAHDAGMIEPGEDLPLLHKFSRNFPVSIRPQDLHGSFQPDTILNALGAIDHARGRLRRHIRAVSSAPRSRGRSDARFPRGFRGAPARSSAASIRQLAPEIGVVRAMDGKEVLPLARRHVDGRREKLIQPPDP